MSLAKKFGWGFDSEIQRRGRTLLKSKAIEKVVRNEDDLYLEATVVGTSKYKVIFDFVDGGLSGSCNSTST